MKKIDLEEKNAFPKNGNFVIGIQLVLQIMKLFMFVEPTAFIEPTAFVEPTALMMFSFNTSVEYCLEFYIILVSLVPILIGKILNQSVTHFLFYEMFLFIHTMAIYALLAAQFLFDIEIINPTTNIVTMKLILSELIILIVVIASHDYLVGIQIIRRLAIAMLNDLKPNLLIKQIQKHGVEKSIENIMAILNKYPQKNDNKIKLQNSNKGTSKINEERKRTDSRDASNTGRKKKTSEHSTPPRSKGKKKSRRG